MQCSFWIDSILSSIRFFGLYAYSNGKYGKFNSTGNLENPNANSHSIAKWIVGHGARTIEIWILNFIFHFLETNQFAYFPISSLEPPRLVLWPFKPLQSDQLYPLFTLLKFKSLKRHHIEILANKLYVCVCVFAWERQGDREEKNTTPLFAIMKMHNAMSLLAWALCANDIFGLHCGQYECDICAIDVWNQWKTIPNLHLDVEIYQLNWLCRDSRVSWRVGDEW